MDKEAQEKIDKFYTDIWFQIKDESQMIKDQVMKMLGYYKLPKDKPPLLEDNPYKVYDLSRPFALMDEHEEDRIETACHNAFEKGKQTQREADIKHYEGSVTS